MEMTKHRQDNYSMHVKRKMTDLNISQEELARVIGGKMNQTMLSRILDVNEPNAKFFSEEDIIKIEEYFIKCSYVEEYGFYHIPSEEFLTLFNEMVQTLKKLDITQEQYGGKIGMSQKSVSSYCANGNVKGEKRICASAFTQYMMIQAFKELAEKRIGELRQKDIPVGRTLAATVKKLGGKNGSLYAFKAYRHILTAFENGRPNLFLLEKEKLDMFRHYLALFLEKLDLMKRITFFGSHKDKDADYTLPADVASLEFIKKMPSDVGFYKAMQNAEDRESVTGNSYCSGLRRQSMGGSAAVELFAEFLAGKYSEYLRIYNAMPPSEKKMLNDELDLIYKEFLPEFEVKQKRALDFYKHAAAPSEYDVPVFYTSPDEFEKEQYDIMRKYAPFFISGAADAFAECPLSEQKLILDNYDAFFGAVRFDVSYDEKTYECNYLKSWLSEMDSQGRKRFIGCFQNDLLSGVWESISRDKLTLLNFLPRFSQYSALMSNAAYKAVFPQPRNLNLPLSKQEKEEAEHYMNLFKRYGEAYFRDPEDELRRRLKYTASDWYAHMLLDIAFFVKHMTPYDIKGRYEEYLYAEAE